jgi:hypothetical protein
MVLGIIIFIIIATGNKRVKGQSPGISSIVGMILGIIIFIIIAIGTLNVKEQSAGISSWHDLCHHHVHHHCNIGPKR